MSQPKLRGTKALPHRKAVAPALFQTYSFPGIPPVHPLLRFDCFLEFPSLARELPLSRYAVHQLYGIRLQDYCPPARLALTLSHYNCSSSFELIRRSKGLLPLSVTRFLLFDLHSLQKFNQTHNSLQTLICNLLRVLLR